MYENMHTARSAMIAAGGVVEAMRSMCDEEEPEPLDSVFAIVRPPGHHAHCNRVHGFCYFNNVALATKVAQS